MMRGMGLPSKVRAPRLTFGRKAVVQAMARHVLAKGVLVGTCERA